MAWVVDAFLVLIGSALLIAAVPLPLSVFVLFPYVDANRGFTLRRTACQRVGHMGGAPVRHETAHRTR